MDPFPRGDGIELQGCTERANVRAPQNLGDGGRAMLSPVGSAHVGLLVTVLGTYLSSEGRVQVAGPQTDANAPTSGVARKSPPSDVCLRIDLKNTCDGQ